jgi:RNA polymerase sigma-70 factor (ECF subfamily)
MSGSGPDMGKEPPKLEVVPGSAETPPRAAALSSDKRNDRFAELFQAHNRDLLRFLTMRLHSTQEAKEVAQEAYVRLLQLDELGGIGYLRAYLFKTAANLAADRLKSAARRERIDHLEFFDESAEFEPSLERRISAEQEVTQIMAMLNELPPLCRYAFIMHRLKDHSIADVAKLMGKPVRTVQWYVERALVFCRERLYPSGGRP